MKRYTPNLLIKYLIKEFSISLIIFTIIFSYCTEQTKMYRRQTADNNNNKLN